MLLSPYPREITANARFDNLLPGTQLLSLVSLPVLLTSLARRLNSRSLRTQSFPHIQSPSKAMRVSDGVEDRTYLRT